MNQLALSNRVQKIALLLSRMEKTVSSLNSMDPELFPQEYLDLSTQAALLSERITCYLRNIVYATSCGTRAEYLQRAASVQGIKIIYDANIIMVELPALLSKKQGPHSSQIIMDPLNTALEIFVQPKHIPRFRECTICILHIYDNHLNENIYFDYDNKQSKQLIDTIATHMLIDDNATLCDLYQTAVASDRDCTRVYIMPKDRFVGWLIEQKSLDFPC